MPWYRNLQQPVFYYLAEILENLTPSSPFPDEEYASFNKYFIKKYNLEIFDQKQNLLDVDFTSNRGADLLAVVVDEIGQNCRTDVSREVKALNGPRRLILVQEFCRLTPIVGSSNESMNADIVYTLCPYLDLTSMFSLAAAFPIWSPIIRKYMKREEPHVYLRLNWFVLVQLTLPYNGVTCITMPPVSTAVPLIIDLLE